MRGTWPFRLVVTGMAIALFAPLLAMVEVLPSLAAMYTLLCGVMLSLVGSIAGIVVGVRHQAGRAWAAGFAGLLPLILTLIVVAPGLGAPRINDVTTNYRNSPLLRDGAPYPPQLVPDLRAAYRDLRTVRVRGPAAEAMQVAIGLARSRTGWTVVTIDDPGLTFHVEARTLLFRFVDDVVVRFRRVPEGVDLLADMRSRSRVGRGDLGANARRIRDYLADLQLALRRPER